MRSTVRLLSYTVASLFALAPSAAGANSFTATLTLTPTNATAVQQTAQEPCIFGNPPCKQQNETIGTNEGLGHAFPWERTPVSAEDGGTFGPLITGDESDAAPWGGGPGESDDYDGSKILVGQVGDLFNTDSFLVGIDVNQASEDQAIYTILEFVLQVFSGATNLLLDSWTFTDAAATPGQVPATNNGTGWSDAVLNFANLDLDNYANSDYLIFKTTWEGNTDGADQYFLKGTGGPRNPPPPPPPPPPAIPEPASIMLLGSGLAGAIWRRKFSRR